MSPSRLRSFVVSGSSMSPALEDGDRFLGRRMAAGRSPARGSVVAFPHPRRSGFWLVKRVIGLSGEMITIETGEVAVNGKTRLDRWGRGASAPDGEWTVPEGTVFVLSDQRHLTRDDSRSFGPASSDNLYRMILPPLIRRLKAMPLPRPANTHAP